MRMYLAFTGIVEVTSPKLLLSNLLTPPCRKDSLPLYTACDSGAVFFLFRVVYRSYYERKVNYVDILYYVLLDPGCRVSFDRP